MKKKLTDIIKAIGHKIEPSHPVLIPLALGVIGLIIFNGHKLYQFTQKNPQYCQMCHVIKEPVLAWEKSAHRNIICQDCHSMDILSQNKLLLAYIVARDKSSIKQEHGLEKPWDGCKACHLDTASQGGVTVRKSYGHARHVFMEKIACKECHTGDKHNFTPDEKKCLKCHADKGVHGMGMESFACLSCHVYGEKTSMPQKKKCLVCHNQIPAQGTMSALECQRCHKPHGKLKPADKECLVCHANQSSIGRHDKHMNISCLTCHIAHIWRVGAKQAKTLCGKCHAYRDPGSFIF